MMNTNDLKKKLGLTLKILLGVGGLALVVWYSSGALHERIPADAAPAAPGGRAVPAGTPTVVARLERAPARVELVGTLASEERVNLSARLTAHVKSVRASAGQRVEADAVLVTLDDRDLREQVAAAEAQHTQAEAEVRRARQLFEASATTQQALDAAEAMVRAAKARVDQARIMLGYAEIRSPMKGVVTDRRVEAGDLAGAGQVLMAVYDPKRMRLEAAVPVRLLDHLPVGREVSVRLDRPAQVLKGRVSEMVAEMDPVSRTQLVKVTMDAVPEDLPPGAFGRLLVDVGDRPVLWVPSAAVYRAGQLEFIQVVRDGRAVRRLVRTGAREGDRMEILSGLQDGETVVTQPLRED